MIVHKSNLNIVDVIREDKGIPMLNNIHFDKDGISSAIGNKVVLAVSAVKDDVKSAIKKMHNWEQKEIDDEGITIPAESIKEVLKNIPKDTQFKGLLEHVDIDDQGIFRLSDGKRERVIKCSKWDREYPDWRKTFELKTQTTKYRGVYNRKRLLLLLTALEKCCDDTSGYSPVWLEGCDDGTLILRGVNMRTGQKAIGIVAAYEGKEAEWIDNKEFEKETVKQLPKKLKQLPKKD